MSVAAGWVLKFLLTWSVTGCVMLIGAQDNQWGKRLKPHNYNKLSTNCLKKKKKSDSSSFKLLL
jgi:hypothetical protein